MLQFVLLPHCSSTYKINITHGHVLFLFYFIFQRLLKKKTACYTYIMLCIVEPPNGYTDLRFFRCNVTEGPSGI